MEPTKKRRGGDGCCVHGCANNSMNSRHVSWHGFPKDEADRKVWIRRINRSKPSYPDPWQPSRHQKICGAHFNATGRRGYLDRLPTIFPNRKYKHAPSPYSSCKSLADQPRPKLKPEAKLQAGHLTPGIFFDKTPSDVVEQCQSTVGAFVELPLYSGVVVQVITTGCPLRNRNVTALANLDHPYAAKKVVVDTPDQEIKPDPALKKNTKEVECKDDDSPTRINKDLKAQLELAGYVNKDLEARVELMQKLLRAEKAKTGLLQQSILVKTFRKDLCAAVLMEDEKCLKFYTGFSTRDHFIKFLKLVRTRTEGCNPPSGRTGRPSCLSFEDQVAMVLSRLRLGLLEDDLGFRFAVSTSTISRLVTFWVPFLLGLMDEISVWPIPDVALDCLPEEFRPSLASTEEVSMECSEISLQVLTEANVLSDVHVRTAKLPKIATALVGLAQNGFVCFVSDLTVIKGKNSTSLRNAGSKLEEMAAATDDRFGSGGQLKTPCPVLQSGELWEDEEDEVMTLESLKTQHINTVIREVKRFRILKCMPMCGKLNAIWKLCCYLTNFIRDSPQVKE